MWMMIEENEEKIVYLRAMLCCFRFLFGRNFFSTFYSIFSLLLLLLLLLLLWFYFSIPFSHSHQIWKVVSITCTLALPLSPWIYHQKICCSMYFIHIETTNSLRLQKKIKSFDKISPNLEWEIEQAREIEWNTKWETIDKIFKFNRFFFGHFFVQCVCVHMKWRVKYVCLDCCCFFFSFIFNPLRTR